MERMVINLSENIGLWNQSNSITSLFFIKVMSRKFNFSSPTSNVNFILECNELNKLRTLLIELYGLPLRYHLRISYRKVYQFPNSSTLYSLKNPSLDLQ